ncbi:MAG: hypothetical protein ACLGIW_14505, partial [Gammaproteobacteria bacterium]
MAKEFSRTQRIGDQMQRELALLIQREIKEGPARLRVGIRPEGRAPAREGTIITTPDGREVGIVTS